MSTIYDFSPRQVSRSFHFIRLLKMFAPICFCIRVSSIDLPFWTIVCPLVKGIRRSFFSMGYNYWKGASTDCAGPIKYTTCSGIWKPCSVRQYLRNPILSSSLVVAVDVPLQEQIIFQSHPLSTILPVAMNASFQFPIQVSPTLFILYTLVLVICNWISIICR